VRSPEVWAEKAPPVKASSGCGSWARAGAGVTSVVLGVLEEAEKENMAGQNRIKGSRHSATGWNRVFSLLFWSAVQA
jgi:hypothetical protein